MTDTLFWEGTDDDLLESDAAVDRAVLLTRHSADECLFRRSFRAGGVPRAVILKKILQYEDSVWKTNTFVRFDK